CRSLVLLQRSQIVTTEQRIEPVGYVREKVGRQMCVAFDHYRRAPVDCVVAFVRQWLFGFGARHPGGRNSGVCSARIVRPEPRGICVEQAWRTRRRAISLMLCILAVTALVAQFINLPEIVGTFLP